MKLRVDMSQWTFGDAIDLEEYGYSQADLRRLFAAGDVPAKLATIIVWLFRRKEEPTFTYEDAKALPMTSELEIEIVGESDSPKGKPNGDGSPPSVSAPGGRPKKSAG